MSIFAMPIVLMIEADSIEEAQKAIDDWSEEVDLDEDLPVGTEDIDTTPPCDHNDEGQRLVYLPAVDDEDMDPDDEMDDDEEDDDFNGSSDLF